MKTKRDVLNFDNIKGRDIIDYYKGKRGKEVVEADRLLFETAKNNFDKGFKAGQNSQIKKVFSNSNISNMINLVSYNKGFEEGQLTERKKCVKMIEELKMVLINRICRPNKPINTFENAKEQEEVIKEEFEELLSSFDNKGENNSPSQQTSVVNREIVHTKKISDVGENPISDTNLPKEKGLCKCGHSIYAHWNDCHTLNNPADCLFDDCDCKKYEEAQAKKVSED